MVRGRIAAMTAVARSARKAEPGVGAGSWPAIGAGDRETSARGRGRLRTPRPMPNVVFVVPFVLESSLRFLRAAAQLPGVRVALVSQDPQDRLPADVRQLLAGFVQVADGLDAEQLTTATKNFGRQLGSVEIGQDAMVIHHNA